MAGWRKDDKSAGPRKPIKSTEVTTNKPARPASSTEKPSWKSTRKPTSSKPFWVQGGPRSNRWRGLWLFGSAVTLITVAIIFVFSLMPKGDATDCIILAGLNFDSPWQPNSWAKEDAERLEAWFNARQSNQALQCRSFFDEATTPYGKSWPWDNILKTQIQQAKAGGPGGSEFSWSKYKSLVIYISAHGIVRDGQPVLAFSNESLAPFADVLDVIKTAEDATRILLLVDQGRQLPDARIPVFSTEFFELAKSKVQELNRRNLAVIFSAGKGQISWPAPELNGTIFGAYVAQGFSGAADKNSNSEITVRELADYLSRQVNAYAHQTRAAMQEPQIVWSAQEKDFDVAYCESTKTQTLTPATIDSGIFTRIADCWNRFPTWRSQRLQDHPWLVAKVRNEIGHADQLAWAGKYYLPLANAKLASADAALKETLPRMTNLPGTSRWPGQAPQPKFNLTHDANAPVTTPASNAQTPDGTAKDEKSSTKASPPAANDPNAPKPTYADQAYDWLIKPPAEDGKKPAPPVTKQLDEFFVFAWWWLKQSPDHWTQKNLEGLSKLWPPMEQAPQEVRMEDALLRQVIEDSRLIAGIWDADSSVNANWPELLVSLEQIQTSFYKVLQTDARVLQDREARVQVEDALQVLRQARDELHARKLVSQTLSSSSVASTESLLKQLANKWKLLDQSMDELQVVANWLFDPQLQQPLTAAVEATTKLSSDINSDPSSLAKLMDQIRGRYRTEVRELLNDQQGLTKRLMPETLHDIYLHLHHLPVDSTQRRELHDNFLAHFQSFTSGAAKSPTPVKPEDVRPIERDLTIPPAVLGLFPPLVNIDAHSQPDRSDSEKVWQTLLKDVTTSDGRHQAVAAGKLEPRQAAMAVRMATNWQPTPPTFDAARLLEESAWQNYLLWRADGFGNDFWRTPELVADLSRPYFAICAQSFLDECDKLVHAPKQPRQSALERLQQRVSQSIQWSELLAKGSTEIDKTQKIVTLAMPTDAYPAGLARNWTRMKRLGDWSAAHLASTQVGASASRTPFAIAGEEGKLYCDYRGHTASLPFEFGRPKLQWSVENDFARDLRTTVTVSTSPQPIEIVFALDCSKSFTSKNFQIAKDNLTQALQTLRGRPNVKIALVVFGHSNTWINKINDAWRSKFPTLVGSDFSTDVAVLEGLTEPSPRVIERIEQDYLANLAPYGNTPLYYAALQCKQLLDRSFDADKTANVFRRVILITDGENMVVPTDTGTPTGKPLTEYPVKVNPSIAEVSLAYSRGAGAQLNILHIGTGKDAQLEALANKTEGQYINSSFQNLANVLATTLEPLRYSVVHVDQRKANDLAGQLTFGTESHLDFQSDTLQADPREVVVTFYRNNLSEELGRMKIDVYPGDRVEMDYDRLNNIFTFPFKGYQQLPLRLNGQLQAWRLPSRDNYHDVRFQLDRTKRTDQTLRPQWSFIEVGSSGAKPKPVFWSSDVYWESGQLRPVGRVTFSGPASDHVLPARLWICQHEQGPTSIGTIDMKDVYQAGVEKLHEVGGKFKVRAEGQQTAGKYLLEVSVVSGEVGRIVLRAPQANRVKHQFFEDGRVVYGYEYDTGKPSGQLTFFLAPTETDASWISTEWTE